MKFTHSQRRRIENDIMHMQELIVLGKAEIASSTCEISKETKHEIDKVLNS